MVQIHTPHLSKLTPPSYFHVISTPHPPQFCSTTVFLGCPDKDSHFTHSCSHNLSNVLTPSQVKTLTPIQSASITLLPHPLSLPRYTAPNFFTPVLKDLISCLLQTDVTKRFGNLRRGADDIKSHEWFRSINWLDVFNRRGTAPFRPPARGVTNLGQRPSGDAATMLEISDHDEFADEFKDF